MSVFAGTKWENKVTTKSTNFASFAAILVTRRLQGILGLCSTTLCDQLERVPADDLRRSLAEDIELVVIHNYHTTTILSTFRFSFIAKRCLWIQLSKLRTEVFRFITTSNYDVVITTIESQSSRIVRTFDRKCGCIGFHSSHPACKHKDKNKDHDGGRKQRLHGKDGGPSAF